MQVCKVNISWVWIWSAWRAGWLVGSPPPQAGRPRLLTRFSRWPGLFGQYARIHTIARTEHSVHDTDLGTGRTGRTGKDGQGAKVPDPSCIIRFFQGPLFGSSSAPLPCRLVPFFWPLVEG